MYRKISLLFLLPTFIFYVAAMEPGEGQLFELRRTYGGSMERVFATDIVCALIDDDIDTLVLYISNSNVNARNMCSETLLHTAVAHGGVKSVQFLLEHGARINVIDQIGCTPLIVAAGRIYDKYPTIVQILIENGAAVNVEDSKGYTPLMEAAKLGRVDAIKILLDVGAKINAKCDFGDTALDVAAARGHEDVMRVLLEAGAVSGKNLK